MKKGKGHRILPGSSREDYDKQISTEPWRFIWICQACMFATGHSRKPGSSGPTQGSGRVHSGYRVCPMRWHEWIIGASKSISRDLELPDSLERVWKTWPPSWAMGGFFTFALFPLPPFWSRYEFRNLSFPLSLLLMGCSPPPFPSLPWLMPNHFCTQIHHHPSGKPSLTLQGCEVSLSRCSQSSPSPTTTHSSKHTSVSMVLMGHSLVSPNRKYAP